MFDLEIFSALGETRMICISMACIVLNLNCSTCNHIITKNLVFQTLTAVCDVKCQWDCS